MLGRTDLEPVFFAPFVSSVMRVEPGWIDYNGHLNMAYYNVLFDRALEEAFTLAGLGEDYLARGGSYFALECHNRYLREIGLADPVRMTLQLLDWDPKRIHYFMQLFHATEGWVAATFEAVSIHIDMTAKKSAPWPADVAARLARMHASHAMLPLPEAAGRRVSLKPQ